VKPPEVTNGMVGDLMNLRQVQRILQAEVIAGDGLDSIEVAMACGADLMSDVLAYIKTGSLLLTGLTNPQVIRTAEMANVEAICFVRGKRPPPDTIALAHSMNLPLLLTELPMFESCGRLYGEGLTGCSERH
jgi:predicted transcriptional regulator